MEGLTSAQQKALMEDLYYRLNEENASSAAAALVKATNSTQTRVERNKTLAGDGGSFPMQTKARWQCGICCPAATATRQDGRRQHRLKDFCCKDDVGDYLWSNDCYWRVSDDEEVLGYSGHRSPSQFSMLTVQWGGDCFHGEFDANDPDPDGYDDGYCCSAAFTLQRA